MKFEIYSLGNLCSRIASGGTPKSTKSEYYDGGIPWLNTKEVNFNRIYATERNISELGLKSSSAKWIAAPSVIVAMYGATAGKVAVGLVPLTTNQACCNMEIQEDKADFRFVYYYLKWKSKRLSSLANGGAQQNLNAQLIKDFPINLPCLPVQNRIADILWSIDDKIELNQKINENLERQMQALFTERFLKHTGSNLSNGWKRVRLGDAVSICNKSFNPLKEPEILLEHYSIPAFDESKFPVFELSINIKSNKLAIGTSWWIGRFRTPYHTASFPPLVQQIGSQHYIQKAMCRSF